MPHPEDSAPSGPTQLPFIDRESAGDALAGALARSVDASSVILALPRGGVPVAAAIARRTGASLDVMLVRKLGSPGQPEIAAGAIASGGIVVFNREVIRSHRIASAALDAVVANETRELLRRERVYRGDTPAPEVADRHVLLVDDGIATGSTMLAAVRALRQRAPRCITVAVPVAARDAVARLDAEADAVLALAMPEPFGYVGRWYRDFFQVSDAEVRRLLVY